MSNIIQIKRGNGAPGDGALKIGELGLDLNTNTLYVGQATDQSPSAAAVIPFARVALSSFGSQTANYVLAAPNGSNGTPTFRALAAADIPNLAASKITSGTLAIARGGTGAATAAINTVFAGPSSGSTAAPSFRALIAADIPNLNASKITAGTFDVARIPNLSASKITGGTINGNIYIGEATDDVNRYIYLRSSLGGIGFYSNGSSNSTKGIWLQAHGTDTNGKAMISADTNNNITFGTAASNINIKKSSGDTYFLAERTDTSVQVGFGVGSGGTNHGIWSYKQGRWLIYGDASEIYIGGRSWPKFTYGTGDPSGGSTGDIYIKYS